MPPSDGYAAAQPSPKKGFPCCRTICIVIGVLVIIGIIMVAMFLLPLLNLNGGTTGYQTREIDSYNNSDVELYPTFYRAEFYVSSSDTQTSTVPDLDFEIYVSTGSDSVTVTIHIAVYDCSLSTFDELSWSTLDSSYLMDDGDYTSSVNTYINLDNYANTYVWVVWFDASYKSSVWSVDIDLTLRYNW